MARPTPMRRNMGRGGFALLFIALLFAAILPLDRLPGRLPGPDLLLVVTFVWVIRRPKLVPVALIAVLFLLADLMLMRPPGLMAAAVVLATEYVRARNVLVTEVPFAVEWSVAGSMMASAMVGSSAVLSLFSVTGPPLGPLLVQVIATVLAYPVVVFAARYLLRIGRPGRDDELGFRGHA